MGAGRARSKSVSVGGMGGVGGSSEPDLSDFPTGDLYKYFAEVTDSPLERVAIGWDFENNCQLVGEVLMSDSVEQKVLPYIYERWGEAGIEKFVEYEFRQEFRSNEEYLSSSADLRTSRYSGEVITSALNQWSDGSVGSYGSTEIRHAQTREVDSSDGRGLRSRVYAKSLESLISAQGGQSPSTMYRGVVSQPGFVQSLVPGATIDFRGISSWSTSRSTATQFARNYSKTGSERILFVLPKLSTNKTLDISSLSNYGGEGERIMSRTVRPKVKDVYTNDDGISVVELEV